MATKKLLGSSCTIEILQQVLNNYQSFDQKVDELLAKQSAGVGLDQQLASLTVIRNEIEAIQDRARDLPDFQKGSGDAESSHANRIVDQTKDLIQNLLQKVAALEGSAKDSYQRLVPDINQTVRGKQMKQAYRDV